MLCQLSAIQLRSALPAPKSGYLGTQMLTSAIGKGCRLRDLSSSWGSMVESHVPMSRACLSVAG